MNSIAESGASLIFFHGGLFVRTPTLVYMEGEINSCYVDPDMVSVGDLRGIVVELGYAKHRIRRLHLRRPNVAFEESLLPIESESDVHYLLELLMNESSVSIYVEHEDNDNWANMCDVGCSEQCEVGGEGGIQGRNTEHKRQFPKFKENTRPEDVQLVTGLLFTDKRQLKKAVETYKIQNGYNLKVTKSDKQRYQVHCVGEGCKWSMWASACGDERSFQIKTVQGTHSCLRRPEEGDSNSKKVQSSEKLSRKGHRKTCIRCGVSGHTKRSCVQ